MKLQNFDFRIWNNNSKTYEAGSIIESLGFITSVFNQLTYEKPTIDYEIELWTGYFDKNGNKIYENDIVEYHENEALIIKYIKGTFYACQDYEKFMKKYECQDNKDTEKFWLEEAYKINNLRIDDNNFIARFEIIGNIHENKELLK
ncbi:hypothetical protein FYY76_02820 [Campylobacter jejuni]|nr:hypothetical protein [Campylobacter jejuni]